jgi:phospholipase C
MAQKFFSPRKWRTAAGASILALLNQTVAPTFAMAADAVTTKTPIKHVIVIIGENRSFDHVFATYKPKAGETVDNLLSKHIVREDGSPDANFSSAFQYSAEDTAADGFQISPGGKSLYPTLPPPLTGGPSDVCKDNGICNLGDARTSENGLAQDYYQFLLTGGTGQASRVPDQRIQNVNNLPPGPFQLTSSTMPYDSYAASPVHRFYQMWQELDCKVTYATTSNPSGCLYDLVPWVEVTIGAGSNGNPPPNPFTAASTHEGSTGMGFYNVLQGDAPYFKSLADNFAMSDNYHQGVQGGTGANHVMLGFADAMAFSNANFTPGTPPHNQVVAVGSKNQGTVDEIENPNARAGTNNWYTEDGYGNGGFGGPASGGGTYTNCSDPTAPGVSAVVTYLQAFGVNPNCAPGHYYLLNNYNPGYFGDGSNAYTDNNDNNTPFTIPPSNLRSIGDALNNKGISWAYYGDQWNAYLGDKFQLNYGTVGKKSDQYCNICNPFQYESSIMTDLNQRAAHLKDTADLYQDIQNGSLPAVSYVKPSGWVDGHPASSKLNLFEGFVKKIVDEVQSNKALWQSTAILITFDEGGGYWDSGYVQAVDFFGDGTRIPMIAVSPFTKPGHISHVYNDHASVVKFIEANWGLAPLTGRSRDNLPNPRVTAGNPYAPVNSPAIGDLMDLFDFQ